MMFRDPVQQEKSPAGRQIQSPKPVHGYIYNVTDKYKPPDMAFIKNMLRNRISIVVGL